MTICMVHQIDIGSNDTITSIEANHIEVAMIPAEAMVRPFHDRRPTSSQIRPAATRIYLEIHVQSHVEQILQGIVCCGVGGDLS